MTQGQGDHSMPHTLCARGWGWRPINARNKYVPDQGKRKLPLGV